MSISLPKFLPRVAVQGAALQVLSVACAWLFFYHVSVDWMAYFSFNHETFWVFLPAGVRLVAVILFGWVGVVGLFVGNVLTPDDVSFSHVLLLSAVLDFPRFSRQLIMSEITKRKLNERHQIYRRV